MECGKIKTSPTSLHKLFLPIYKSTQGLSAFPLVPIVNDSICLRLVTALKLVIYSIKSVRVSQHCSIIQEQLKRFFGGFEKNNFFNKWAWSNKNINFYSAGEINKIIIFLWGHVHFLKNYLCQTRNLGSVIPPLGFYIYKIVFFVFLVFWGLSVEIDLLVAFGSRWIILHCNVGQEAEFWPKLSNMAKLASPFPMVS